MRGVLGTLSSALVLSLLPVIGCSGGGASPVTPQGDSIPLDGRGGGVLAYTYQPGSSSDIHQIFAMNADGTGSRRLITASIGLNHHDWSPDAQRLAAVGYYGDTWSVHTFNADGTALRRLTDTPDVWDNEPTWSPDGSRIVFTRSYPNEGFRSEVWLMNADGTDPHSIGIDGFVARWSPDGARLVFQSAFEASGEASEIATCKTDGSDLVLLTQTPSNELTPIWSPDGSRIAFVADYDGDYDIYVMDSDGSNVRKITENSVEDYSPRWSPDGTRLAFDSDSSGDRHWEVYVIGVDGSGLIRLTNTPAPATAINPTWRPGS